MEQPIFSNDKLLSSAPDSVLSALVLLSEALILQYPDKMCDALTEHYLQSLLYACCHHSYALRKSAQMTAKKVVSGLGGVSLALILINLLNKLLHKQNWTRV